MKEHNDNLLALTHCSPAPRWRDRADLWYISGNKRV